MTIKKRRNCILWFHGTMKKEPWLEEQGTTNQIAIQSGID